MANIHEGIKSFISGFSVLFVIVCFFGFGVVCVKSVFLNGVKVCTRENSSPSSTGAVIDDIKAAPVTYIEVEMEVTAYCAESCCCGKFADGITASGRPAKGLLIAAPPEYPFGTVMDVPGYGIASVEDRGGAIKGNKLDLFFEDKDGVSGHQRALNWGRQIVMVKVHYKESVMGIKISTFEWPSVFIDGKVTNKNKVDMVSDGLTGWAGCMMRGHKIPDNFGKGMAELGSLLEISPVHENFMKLSMDMR